MKCHPCTWPQVSQAPQIRAVPLTSAGRLTGLYLLVWTLEWRRNGARRWSGEGRPLQLRNNGGPSQQETDPVGSWQGYPFSFYLETISVVV